MISKSEKKLWAAYEKIIAISLNQESIDGFEQLVDKQVMGFGTTIDEHITNIAEYKKLILQQEQQATDSNIQFKIDRKPIHSKLMSEGTSALFIELISVSVINEEVQDTFTFRCSTLLERIENDWKLIHWHGSIPVDSENDSWHIRQWEREKEKLEQQVASQTADLQQKNRELEIEAALERVRSQAMAMQKGEELATVISVVFDGLVKLGFNAEGCGLNLYDERKGMDMWMSGFGDNIYPESFHINYFDHPFYHKQLECWQNGHIYDVLVFDGELKKQYDDQTFSNPDFFKISDDIKAAFISKERVISCSAYMKYGMLEIIGDEEISPNQANILCRFSNVFEQAYTRFLDLKKAEEQTREAQVELSLERIRSLVTSMQESADLFDIVVSMRNEFLSLGHFADYFWHMRWLPDVYEMSMTSEDGNRLGMVINVPKFVHDQIPDLAAWEKGDDPLFVLALDAEGAWDYIDNMNKYGDYELIDPNTPTKEDIEHIGGLTFIIARTTHGEIGYSLPGVEPYPPTDALETLLRFAGVFDLAYRRFEDLLQAEQRAYASKVDASLEKVRAMAAAMNHSDDLKQIAEFMFHEMEILQIKPLRYGLAMINEPAKEAELWASTVDDGKYLDLLGTIDLNWHPMLTKGYEAWEKQYEEFVYQLKGKELNSYYERISKVNQNIKNLDSLLDPNSVIVQYCSFFPFNSGILYAFTENEPDEDGLSILKQFSNVFEQAHIRFEDLQKSEEQDRLIREERDRLEIALKELEATKDQLVQQEKLASLGQLTAGIAHEIKNPLNFVNNFSDLSIELLDEAKEELLKVMANHKLPEQETEEITDILSDIEANLKKIHEHGTRADSIVKSMLQHSRGGSGTMEPVNLNALLKEFVNLSFHGMRASKHPINVDIEIHLDESNPHVSAIAEDFSRVILNICNNAFDAMREKLKASDQESSSDDYKPILKVKSARMNGKVSVVIEDNGPGIPDEMKDKITQPFFTTKKGTDGTGLGLSITHDIVKAHGGNLGLQSKVGEGSTFIIELPDND